jgi:ketosteroid isomerase-like protein
MQVSEVATMHASREQWIERVANGDAAGAAALYKEDATMLPPNADPVQGRGAIQIAIQGMIDAGVRSVAMDALDVKEGGDLVVECGHYHADLRGGHTDVGKYLVVHERQEDGSLKLALDMYSSNRPAG